MTKTTAAWTENIKKRYDGRLSAMATPKRMGDGRLKYQPLDSQGRPLGRSFMDGTDFHKLLYKLYPQIINVPSRLAVPPGQQITLRTRLVAKKRKISIDSIPAAWWRERGFKTKKDGLAFAKKLRHAGFEVTYERLGNLLTPDLIAPVTIAKFLRSKTNSFKIEQMASPFQNFNASYIIKHKYIPSICQDLRKYFQTFDAPIFTTIQRFRGSVSTSIKILMSVTIQFYQHVFGDSFWAGPMAGDMTRIYKTSTFFTSVYKITRDDQVQETIEDMMEEINAKVESYQKEGSGWILDRIEKAFINMAKFQFTTGSSWINLRDDPFFKNTQSIVNVKNFDDNCFKYAAMVGKHYDGMSKSERGKLQEANRVSGIFNKMLVKYPILNSLEMPFKFSCEKMEMVEHELQMKIHVLQYTKWSGQLLPFYCSKAPYEKLYGFDFGSGHQHRDKTLRDCQDTIGSTGEAYIKSQGEAVFLFQLPWHGCIIHM